MVVHATLLRSKQEFGCRICGELHRRGFRVSTPKGLSQAVIHPYATLTITDMVASLMRTTQVLYHLKEHHRALHAGAWQCPHIRLACVPVPCAWVPLDGF
eukprot:108347-Chlamydomonas_euryale.AAC.2